MRRRGASSHACHVSSAGTTTDRRWRFKPPAAPRLTERGPGSNAAETQTCDSNRRADRGTGDRAEQHQAHRLPQRASVRSSPAKRQKEPGGDNASRAMPAAVARATSAGSRAVMAARKTPTRTPGHTSTPSSRSSDRPRPSPASRAIPERRPGQSRCRSWRRRNTPRPSTRSRSDVRGPS